MALCSPLVNGLFMLRNEGCVWGESSDSLGSPRSLCSKCQEGRSPSLTVFTVSEELSRGDVTPAKPFSHRGPAVTTKERDVVREMKEKERERRALLSCVVLPVSFELFGGGHGVLVERGCLFLSFVQPCCVKSLEG